MKKYLSLALWIAVFMGVGKFIGDMTRDEIPGWYEGLQKSSLNPPDITFGIVWTILYILIAIAGWRLWQQRRSENGKCLMTLFAVQTFVNWAWSYVFFYYHLLGLGFIWIVALIALVAVLIYKSDRINRLILAPYLLWISFAAYLNFTIWQLN